MARATKDDLLKAFRCMVFRADVRSDDRNFPHRIITQQLDAVVRSLVDSFDDETIVRMLVDAHHAHCQLVWNADHSTTVTWLPAEEAITVERVKMVRDLLTINRADASLACEEYYRKHVAKAS